MEGVQEIVLSETPINEEAIVQSKILVSEEATVVAEPKTPLLLIRPTIVLQNSPIKSGNTPHCLKLPKTFKYPERYTSPTDQMMSPVSKRLLIGRNRKASTLLPLPPSKNRPHHQPMVQGLQLQESGLCQSLNC
ncbi:uncharacterized protein [Nicotiana sylvestris]|uniref:Uncharacterized protein LOC104216341 n=1 Tax=Nicotiana sylvestris TaxID=4096 RepID=A0A1U7VE66_NICSY|nr:PREDICTED: uncharacterized protein LOC104216341 [Nicotiana sylvestris]